MNIAVTTNSESHRLPVGFFVSVVRRILMITGSLQTKKGYYYVCINLKDLNGKRKVKWVSTGLPVDGTSKRKINGVYHEILAEYNAVVGTKSKACVYVKGNLCVSTVTVNRNDNSNKVIVARTVPEKEKLCREAKLPFPDYLMWYVYQNRKKLQSNTRSHYHQMINYRILDYFKDIRTCDVTAQTICDFNNEMLEEGLSPNTVLRYNALIGGGLSYAFKHNIIKENVMLKVEKPSAERYTGAQCYNSEELVQLFEASQYDPIFPIIFLTACYGLRRSEVLGLRWCSIDETNGRITIDHKVSVVNDYGKEVLECSDRMKTPKSRRELPLYPEVLDLLRLEKQKQYMNKKAWGKNYCKEYEDYIFVNEKGELIRPDYVSRHFEQILEKNNLKKIRFHDLRHSCATLLLQNNKSMKEVQEWLGHSNFGTTADIYSHVNFDQKIDCGNSIRESLGLRMNDSSIFNAS